MAKKNRSRQKPAESAAANRAGGPRGSQGARPRTAGPPVGATIEWVGGFVAGLLVLAIGLGYDGRVYGLYFTPRVVYFFVLAALFFLVWAMMARPGMRPFRLDWLDALGGAFVLWQVVSAVAAPTRNLAWFGTYNRTSGAFLWMALGLILLLARRVLAGRRALLPLIWAATLVLFLNATMSATQALGGGIPWGGVSLVEGRMTGTTGNPVNMAGLCLLAAWLGALALLHGGLSRLNRYVAAAGALSGLTATVLAVSRASYIGLGIGFVVLAAVVLLRRRWKAAVVLGVVLVLFVAGTFAYQGSSQRIGGALSGAASQATSGSGSGESSTSQSDQQRVEFWRVALKATGERPVFGYGPGAFATAFRLFVPTALIQQIPNLVVSDPHDFPLLLSSTTGIPGLLFGLGLLFAATAVLGVRAVRGLRRPRGEVGDGFGPVTAAAAYVLAVLAFLLVSPTDLVTVCPLMLVLGAAVGAPVAGARLSVEVSAVVGRPALGKFVVAAAGTVGLALFVLALVMGIRFYEADIASVNASRYTDSGQATRAAGLFPWYPHYEQVAGSLIWRTALNNNGTSAEAERGQRLLLSSLTYDPGQVLARADLARFYLATGRPAPAVEAVKGGLIYCPDSPTLQGLYAYSAYVAAKEVGDPALARSIGESFVALPPTVADGWYWLNTAYEAEGDASAAQTALQKANALAPALTPDDYARRLQGG